MRSLLFRTAPVLIDGAAVVACIRDLDGVAPVTLTLENVDLKASQTTRHGSKDANVRITATVGGTAPNSKRIKYTVAVNSVFGVTVSTNDLTITLAGDSKGYPTDTAARLVDRLNADATFIAFAVVADLPAGCSGLAIFNKDGFAVPGDIQAFTNLAGGAAATVMAVLATAVQHAPTAAGPWVTHTAASTAIGVALAAGAGVSYTITETLRFLRVSLSKGAANTSAVVSCSRGGA